MAHTLLLLSRIQPALKAGQASAELMGIVASLHDWHDFALAIVRCFDEHGHLLSNASPGLKMAREQAFELQERMRTKMTRLIEELDEQGILQDPYFTLRNERYVLPIRSGAMGQVEGIVHDTS